MLKAMYFCEKALECFDVDLNEEYHDSINEDVELFARVITSVEDEMTIDIVAMNVETDEPIEVATCDYLDEDDFYKAVEYVINCFTE